MRFAKGVQNRQYTAQERWCIACSFARMAVLMGQELLKQIQQTKGSHHLQAPQHLPNVHPHDQQSQICRNGLQM